MPDIDLDDLSQAIQDAITDGFNNVVSQMRSGGFAPPPGGAGGGTGGGTPGGGGTSGGSTATPAPDVNTDTIIPEDYEARLTGIQTTILSGLGAITDGAVEGLKASLEEVDDLQKGWLVQAYRNAVRDIGPQINLLTDEMRRAGDFTAINNAGERAAAESVARMKEYAAELSVFEELKLEDISRMRRDIITTFGDINIGLLAKSNESMEKETMRFAAATNMSTEEVAELIGVTFAETGEASADILTQITNQATAVGEAVGMPFKAMSEGIKEVKLDMDTFTDMTVDGAARMVASLGQLGLSLRSFKGMMEPFRDFDSAATKIGDMSAMFGIQMDAMEMMYLANEDEEQFLHRMREQILDQGLDVESMSKTRQRALANQMGLNVREMKQFMSGQIDAASALELQAASGEGATLDQSAAVDTLNNSMVIVTETADKMMARMQELEMTFAAAGSVHEFAENIGAAQGALVVAQSNTAGLSGQFQNLQASIAGATSKITESLRVMAAEKLPQLEEFFNENIKQIQSGWQGISQNFGTNAQQAMNNVAESTNAAMVDAGMTANSWPRAMHELGKTFGDPSVPGGAEQREFYTQSIMSWGESLSSAIRSATIMLSDSAYFEELISNFRDASEEIQAIADEVSTSMMSIAAPDIEVSGGPATSIQVVANNLSEKLAQAVEESISQLEKEKVEVNVTVDMDKLKSDLVATIREGFEQAEYNFNLSLDREKIATVVSRSKTSDNRTFQMRS